MKPIPDCVPDALTMIIAVAKAVSDDDFIHSKVLLKVMGELADEGELGSHPSDVYLQCWEIACRALGVKDPYENEKARGDKIALGVLKSLNEANPAATEVKLEDALKLSFAGSMLDYNSLGRVDMQEKLSEYLDFAPAIDDSAALLEALNKANSVMIVANRAGEIALDKPLCEALVALGKQVYLAVAAKPIFQMATERDAETVGITQPVEVVSPGTSMYGLMPERTSSEFRGLVTSVDVLIAKGNTNYSTMTSTRDVFFILKAGHEEVAAALGIAPGTGAIVKVPATATV